MREDVVSLCVKENGYRMPDDVVIWDLAYADCDDFIKICHIW